MPYVSPGDAFSSTFASVAAQEEAAKRQAFLDSLRAKQVENEIALGQAALQEKRDAHAADLKEKERKDTLSDIANLVPGDIPDADLIARAKTHGIPLRTEPAAPSAPESMPGIAAVPFGQVQTGITPTRVGAVVRPEAGPTAGIRFAGSPKQAEEVAQRARAKAFIDAMPDDDPRKQELKQAFEAEVAGLKVPPGYFSKTGAAGEEAVMRQNPRTGTVERMIDGKWTPWTSDVPKGAHWMTEPAPKDMTARDIAKGNQLQVAREHAYTELDKRAQPIENQLSAIRELGTALNQKTPGADAVIAPLVLKATVAGAGTGFRMTQTEINQVLGAGTHWDSLKRALLKWDTDHSQALSLTDDQREDLRKLTREIRKKATQLSRQITDARHKIDDAEDLPSVNRARTALQESLDKMDDEEGGPSTDAAGIPQVGGTFMGGKVLSVRPRVK